MIFYIIGFFWILDPFSGILRIKNWEENRNYESGEITNCHRNDKDSSFFYVADFCDIVNWVVSHSESWDCSRSAICVAYCN